MRPTKNQIQILSELEKIKGEISAQELHLKLREQRYRIGLATVYRILKSLHLEGRVQERVNSNGESLYSLISQTHHHHLNCINCGESVPLKDCPVNHKLNNWCEEQNFQVYYHTLELFGLCNSCNKSSE